MATPYSELIVGGTGTNNAVNVEVIGPNINSSINDVSGDLRYIAITATGYEVNGLPPSALSSMYVVDRQTGIWDAVDVSGIEAVARICAEPRLSTTGRWVVFGCIMNSSGSVQLYVEDRLLNNVRPFGPELPMDDTFISNSLRSFRLSGNGQAVVFEMAADVSSLGDANGHTDIFRVSVLDGTIGLLSVSSEGVAANGPSRTPSISFDGNRSVFETSSTNLVALQPADLDLYPDIVMREQSSATTTLVSDPQNTHGGGSDSFGPAISGNGRVVSYYSKSTDLMRRDIESGQIDIVFDSFYDISAGEGETAYTNSIDYTGCNVAFFIVYGNAQGGSRLPNGGRLFNCGSQEVQSFGVLEGAELQEQYAVFANFLSANGRMVAFNSTYYNPLDPGGPAIDYGSYVIDTGKSCDENDPALIRQVPANTWVMLSLPCLPIPGMNTIGEVFADDVPGVYGSNWVVFPFDTQTGLYPDNTLDTTLSPGSGFWFRYNSETTPVVEIDLPSASNEAVSQPTDTVCGLGEECQNISLPPELDATSQWSMLGVGRPQPVRRDQLRVSTATGVCSDADGCSFNEAADGQDGAAQVHRLLYLWDPSLDPQTYRIVENDDDLIMPWDAVWLAQYRYDEFNPVTIHVPVGSD